MTLKADHHYITAKTEGKKNLHTKSPNVQQLILKPMTYRKVFFWKRLLKTSFKRKRKLSYMA